MALNRFPRLLQASKVQKINDNLRREESGKNGHTTARVVESKLEWTGIMKDVREICL